MSGIAGKEIEGLDLEPEALSPKGACSARVLRNAKELLDLRCLWEKWATEPTCDMDHFLLVCRTRENVRNPHVIVVSRDDEPVAILAARLENSHIAPSIGYFTPFKFAVRSLSTVYGGLLGRVDDAVATALMNSLNESLEAREADVCLLYTSDAADE